MERITIDCPDDLLVALAVSGASEYGLVRLAGGLLKLTTEEPRPVTEAIQ